MANTLLNQIFYDFNKFDIQPDEYEKYMLFQKYIANKKPLVPIDNEVEKEEIKKEEEKQLSELFMPKVNDKLFCCIYILSIGIGEFHMLGNRYKNAELSEKQKIMDFIQKNKTSIKNSAQNNEVKMTNVKMQNVASELMTDNKTTWVTFWVLCFYYKINVILVQKDIYMEFNTDSIYDTYLFERNDDLKITVDCVKLSFEKMNAIKHNRLKISPFVEKILKGVSSYKTPELQSMMEILKINCDEVKAKKQDLYNTIIKYLVSMKIQN
jgi:hypothetical protein